MSFPAQTVDAVDAVFYGDAFDCAVTLEEATRFSRAVITQDRLKYLLAHAPVSSIVSHRDGFYFMVGRDELVDVRRASMARATMLRKRANRIARWIQMVPFIRGIVLTGSVSVNDADKDADIDLLLIVARRRLSLVFFLLGSVSRLTARCFFCPNYYLSEDHLEIQRRDFYVAREITQASTLTGVGDAFIEANRWVGRFLPNFRLSTPNSRPLFGCAALQWILELPFRGSLGDWLDRKLATIAISRLHAHHQSSPEGVPDKVLQAFKSGVELRFHFAPRVRKRVQRYECLRKQMSELLDSDSGELANSESTSPTELARPDK